MTDRATTLRNRYELVKTELTRVRTSGEPTEDLTEELRFYEEQLQPLGICVKEEASEAETEE